MGARILVFTGKLRGKAFPLPPQGRLVIGRSQNCHITLPDANLSRKHSALTATPKGYLLEDLGSTNGTYVNGKRIKQFLLREGDRITLGESELEFRVKVQFDDTETKIDLIPVEMPEEISPAEAMKLLRVADAERPSQTRVPPTGRLKRLRFCEACDITIPRADIQSGLAREIASRMLCASCVRRLEGKNIDAAASLERVIDDLRVEVQRGKGR